MTATSIQKLAAEVSAMFTLSTRNDGTSYHSFDHSTTPQWVKDLAFDAHDDMAPDDWKFAFIVEALDALAETEDPDDINLEADVYTHDLLRWLASNLNRPAICDEASAEYGTPGQDIVTVIQQGQAYEKSQVLASVRSALEAQIGELDD